MELTSYDSATRYITEECLKAYIEKEMARPVELAIHLMEFPELKMHCPQHHYLVPAVLLTAAYKVQGRSFDMLRDDLTEAMMRSKNVLAGFCGLYGTCGAAVGLGVFVSILTDTTPYSVETWALANRVVAESLMRIARVNGPRCCKRNSFLTLQYAEKFVREELEMDFGVTETIACRFYNRNAECKKKQCPYFPVNERSDLDES